MLHPCSSHIGSTVSCTSTVNGCRLLILMIDECTSANQSVNWELLYVVLRVLHLHQVFTGGCAHWPTNRAWRLHTLCSWYELLTTQSAASRINQGHNQRDEMPSGIKTALDDVITRCLCGNKPLGNKEPSWTGLNRAVLHVQILSK